MKFNQLIITALVAIFAVSASKAEIPSSYYNSLNGKKDGELKTAIHNLVRNFTEISSYQNLPSYFQRTDVYPDSRRWWDMYSDIPLYAPSFSGLNREHSFPKSWWGGLTTVPAYVDLNHLYPSEMAANTAKNNYPLGTVNRNQNIKFNNGISTVGYPVAGQGGGAQYVFEPADEYKGDFARTYFYMVTCYQNLTWKYFYMVNQNDYPTLTTWAADLLIKWHRQDPVSDKEVRRNDEVYKIQNNRNPFIDYPELAELLWGNKKGQVFNAATSSTPVGTPTLITPVNGMSLDFGQVAVGKTTTSKLFINGESLTAPVTLRVYSDDAQYFSASSTSIAANLINSEEGYWLNMTYAPTQTGEHKSKLVLYGGGFDGSVVISLLGQCEPVPNLTAPTALPATEIEETSYIANWIPVEGETVDYYYVNRTRYVDGKATFVQELAEEPGTLIEDFDLSDNETYTVQAVRLGFVSPESNSITVSHDNGVTEIETNNAWAIENIPGGIRFIAGETIPVLTIYDTTGRTVMTLENVEPYTDITLATGVYFVKTNTNGRPVKALVR